ncbi:FxSxx-COOH system tetratricopeptide repeat protein [Amycolatopsis magusensis]|uniref:FxSxx-COOH system tetratricopeptide repeat protein n=1 Tax=Amycolatopsis magusensis TaxID=882444 RepID=UPI003796F3D6
MRALSPGSEPEAAAPAPHAPHRPDAPPAVWGRIPARNLNFTGRADLLELLPDRLHNSTTAVVPVAVHGLGGIGKTQLATEYLYRHLRNYDLIWWIDAACTTRIHTGLADLARALGMPQACETDLAVSAVEALRLGCLGRRWLLIFDGADDPATVAPHLPRTGGGHILITSRYADWAGIARPLPLPPFTREESIALLVGRGPEITAADAGDLADKLGDLPLAIEQAAAWLTVTGMPVHDHLRLLDDSPTKLLEATAAPEGGEPVTTVWTRQFEQLKSRNPAAHQLLHLCAFLAPDPIPRQLLTSPVTISPELDAALRDPITLARAVRDLTRHGLAEIDHTRNTLRVHRLVQRVLRHGVMDPQQHARMQHGAHQLLAALDPGDPESSAHWPRYRDLLPHAHAAELAACEDTPPRRLLLNLMRYLFEDRRHEHAAQLATLARDRFSTHLGPAHPDTLAVSTRLGLYLWALGRYADAAQVNQRTLALWQHLSGEETVEILPLHHNLVLDLRARGDFAAATQRSEQTWHQATRMLGRDDPAALYAAFQHGISLRLSGAYRAAADLDENTHRRQIDVLGRWQPRTLSTLSALLVDLRETGHYAQARVQQEQLTESFRTHYGEDQIDSVVSSFLLAVARRKDGDHPGALALSTTALDRLRLVYGDDHATTMACALAHSLDLRYAGDLAAARELGEQTVQRYRHSLGEHHPHTLAAGVDLAVTMRLHGDASGARTLDEHLLEHLRAGTGPDHPYAIIATINLASDLSALNELDQAIELGRDAIDRGRRVLGEDHPTVLAASHNLGLDLTATGHTDKAAPLREPILDRYRQILGAAHPATQASGRGERTDCDIEPMLM